MRRLRHTSTTLSHAGMRRLCHTTRRPRHTNSTTRTPLHICLALLKMTQGQYMFSTAACLWLCSCTQPQMHASWRHHPMHYMIQLEQDCCFHPKSSQAFTQHKPSPSAKAIPSIHHRGLLLKLFGDTSTQHCRPTVVILNPCQAM